MFFKLARGKNYVLLFFGILGLTLLSAVPFGEKTAGFVFFLSFYYLGALQFRSKLILDRSWTAKSEKDEGPIWFQIATYLPFAVGTIGLLTLLLFPRK